MGFIAGWALGILIVVIQNIINGKISIDINIVEVVCDYLGKIWHLLLIGINGSLFEMIIAPVICLFFLIVGIGLVVFGISICCTIVLWIVAELKEASIMKRIVSIISGILTANFVAEYYQTLGWVLAVIFVIVVLVGMGTQVSGFGFISDGVFWFFKNKD